ncbi:putative signal peptide protein [Puccinia sorghi]|uniref:Putative signal peptide protein n=1 Tax=Puccinia sorghi TaxID=27349 RepID=A0A0L6VU18_9BASI|nr:putative signal peptide protein [Puccinia sorghi]
MQITLLSTRWRLHSCAAWVSTAFCPKLWTVAMVVGGHPNGVLAEKGWESWSRWRPIWIPGQQRSLCSRFACGTRFLGSSRGKSRLDGCRKTDQVGRRKDGMSIVDEWGNTSSARVKLGADDGAGLLAEAGTEDTFGGTHN